MRHAARASAGRRRRRDRSGRRPPPGPLQEGRPPPGPLQEGPPASPPATLHADLQAQAREADLGAAGSGDSGRRWLGQLPYLIVLCGTGLSLLTMRQGEQDVRSGTLELAGVLLIAALARLLLPERRVGLLGSRRRLADVVALAVLGLGLLTAGLVFPAPA